MAIQRAVLVAGVGLGAYLFATRKTISQRVPTQTTNEKGEEGEPQCPDGTELRDDGMCYEPEQGDGCPEGTELRDDGMCYEPDEEQEEEQPTRNAGDVLPDGIEGALASTAITIGTGVLINTATDAMTNKKVPDADVKKVPDVDVDKANKAPINQVDDITKSASNVDKVDDVARTAKTAKLAKGTDLLGKLKGTPADLIMTIITMILVEVLDLDPENFKACNDGFWDMNSLPDWVKAVISGVPFLGDVFDLVGNKLCFKGGCATGTEQGEGIGAGFCYESCGDSFKSDGANVCYKQYPAFENNGMLHTLTSITKNILMDTGVIPEHCPSSHPVKSGDLCYDTTDFPSDNVAGVAWEKCRAGHTDTGARCENLVEVGAGSMPFLTPNCGTHPWIINCRDDGTSLWSDWCDGNLQNCRGGGRVEVWGHERHFECPADKEMIDGLCYNRCPNGFSHVAGMPYLCSASYDKRTQVMAPNPTVCADDKENIDGLCYTRNIPAGYVRKLLGTLDQICPDGTSDGGVFCNRESHWRDTKGVPFAIQMKDRL